MRAVDRMLTLVIGFTLFLFCGLVVVEIVYAATNNPEPLLLPYPTVAEFFRAHGWSAGWITMGAIMLVVLGLLLFISELRRRRPALLVMRSNDPLVAAGISARSIRRVLNSAIGTVPGVEKASTRVGRGTVRVRAVTWAGAPDDVEANARASGEAALSGLHLEKTPRLALSLSAGRS